MKPAESAHSPRFRLMALVGGLLVLYVFMAVSATLQESNTYDEALHLSTGYFYWTHPEIPLWPENGIFAGTWASLPLLADHLRASQISSGSAKPMAQWQQGHDFFFLMGNDPAQMLLQGRLMISLLGAALGALVFVWSRHLFGTGGGVISLILFIFCPTMLAHGALITADMAATLGFTAATYFFWKLSHTVSLPNLSLSILALGCLVLTKMSSPLIVPIFFLILAVRLFSAQPVYVPFMANRSHAGLAGKAGIGGLLLALHAVAMVIILWLFYNFKFNSWNEESVRRQILDAPGFSMLTGVGIKASCLQALSEIHLLPAAFQEGLNYQFLNPISGGFLLGSYSDTGWGWFFPFAFLVKTPISTLLLFLFSMIAYGKWSCLSRGPLPSDGKEIACPSLYDLAPLLILGGVFGMACLTSGLNLGHRYMMPMYPVFFVLAGANVYWLRSSRMIYRVMLGILLAGVMIESIAIRPHYLAFFNQLVGGPRYGYHYLINSSLDWGQDLPGLQRWLEKNAPTSSHAKIYLSYCGTADPEFYGIHSIRLPDFFAPPADPIAFHGGIYCISATLLFGPKLPPSYENLYVQANSEVSRWEASSHDPVKRAELIQEKGQDYWTKCIRISNELKFFHLIHDLQKREPDDEIGYSILIYRLSDGEVEQALRRPVFAN